MFCLFLIAHQPIVEIFVSPNVSLWFFLSLSLFIALILSIFPLSIAASPYRPEFICLVVLYWVFAVPTHLGVVFAFLVGVLQSLVESSIWGGYSLALCFTIYLCLKAIPRLRNYSLLHQSLWIFVWVFLHQLVVSWINGLAGYEANFIFQLGSSLLSATCWPFLLLSMNWVRRSYSVN